VDYLQITYSLILLPTKGGQEFTFASISLGGLSLLVFVSEDAAGGTAAFPPLAAGAPLPLAGGLAAALPLVEAAAPLTA